MSYIIAIWITVALCKYFYWQLILIIDWILDFSWSFLPTSVFLRSFSQIYLSNFQSNQVQFALVVNCTENLITYSCTKKIGFVVRYFWMNNIIDLWITVPSGCEYFVWIKQKLPCLKSKLSIYLMVKNWPQVKDPLMFLGHSMYKNMLNSKKYIWAAFESMLYA